MSSIIIYGNSTTEMKVIDKNTVPSPSNFYGASKFEAENGIKELESTEFKVAIIRPPMIYGKGSRGNYPKLARVAKLLPIFSNFNNKRSMLHIDNLCEFLRLVIINEDKGVFYPQNSEYVKTSDMVKLISEAYGRKIILTPIFNPFIYLLRNKISFLNKIFGDLVYHQSLSEYKQEYRVRTLKESIMLTEKLTTKG